MSYRDADNHKQVTVLEMSRGYEAMLVEILKTRVPSPRERPSVVRPALQASR